MNATDCIQNAWIQQIKFLSMGKDELFACSLHGNAWDFFFFQSRKKKNPHPHDVLRNTSDASPSIQWDFKHLW